MRRLLSGLLVVCLVAGLTGCSMESQQSNENNFFQKVHIKIISFFFFFFLLVNLLTEKLFSYYNMCFNK